MSEESADWKSRGSGKFRASGKPRRSGGSGCGAALTADWKSKGSGRLLADAQGSGDTGSWATGSGVNSGGKTMGEAADSGGGTTGGSRRGELASLGQLVSGELCSSAVLGETCSVDCCSTVRGNRPWELLQHSFRAYRLWRLL